MEIFNIHIFEFLLIAGLALVVFGPERLPEVGRFVGKQVARFLAWQQQSPELKMITDVRSEFEREIAGLRDELVRTRKQLDLAQDAEIKAIRDELRPMLNLREHGQQAQATDATKPVDPAETPKAGDVPSNDAPVTTTGLDDGVRGEVAGPTAPIEVAADTAAGIDPLEVAAEALETIPAAPQGTVPAAVRPNRLAATTPTNVLDQPGEHRSKLHDGPAIDDVVPSPNGQSPSLAAPTLSAPETVQILIRRLDVLSADVQALISGLHAQGLLGQDWEPAPAVEEQEGLAR